MNPLIRVDSEIKSPWYIYAAFCFCSKIVSTITSVFTSCFSFHWSEFFPTTPLRYPPAFDGRVVLYPTKRVLRDYLCWRQADCHINNLYNTVFWALVQEGGLTNNDAQKRLKGTNSGEKNEILFSQFGTNYNTLPQIFRKGTVVIRSAPGDAAATVGDSVDVPFLTLNEDIIRDDFWKKYPEILGPENEE
jgi:tRNA(His) guanylyltransferase